MEAALNLVWFALCVAAGMFWWKSAGRALSGRKRMLSVVALGMLLLLLFPVISLTDDFQAAATLAEADHEARADMKIAPIVLDSLAPLLFAGLLALLCSALQAMAWEMLRLERSLGRLLYGTSSATGCRPPPGAMLCAAA